MFLKTLFSYRAHPGWADPSDLPLEWPSIPSGRPVGSLGACPGPARGDAGRITRRARPPVYARNDLQRSATVQIELQPSATMRDDRDYVDIESRILIALNECAPSGDTHYWSATTRELAEMFGVNKSTVSRWRAKWVKQGKCTTVKRGRILCMQATKKTMEPYGAIKRTQDG